MSCIYQTEESSVRTTQHVNFHFMEKRNPRKANRLHCLHSCVSEGLYSIKYKQQRRRRISCICYDLANFPFLFMYIQQFIHWCNGIHYSTSPADTLFLTWSRITRDPDVGTGPLTHPFACSLEPLTHSLAHPYACSLTLTPKLMWRWMIRWLFLLCFFCSGL